MTNKTKSILASAGIILLAAVLSALTSQAMLVIFESRDTAILVSLVLGVIGGIAAGKISAHVALSIYRPWEDD